MTIKEYEKEIKKHKFGYKLWTLNLLLGTLLLYYVDSKISEIDTYLLIYMFFVLVTLCSHMVVGNLQDIRYKTLAILRLLEKEKFETKLNDINSKFYKIFDNMCCDNSYLKEKIPCKNILAPIVPSSTVKNWRPHKNENKIIGYWAEDFSPYIITCPYQLRDLLIKLQNNL